ncbi:uncharacterized protein LOC108137066 [Drosophila elegans]|uniref:uncharacterized protein LOC108137066 n=1 Tax=Drosophila elegans TaxID=30023 RepID=UPI0007E7EE74|nr:uncharacterized protein LOC108137066 [Drosophila elegans]
MADTPTSLVLKDYVNHELVPILTMDPNGARLAPAPAYTPAPTSAVIPGSGEVTTPGNSCIAHGSDPGLGYSSLSSPLLDVLTTPTGANASGVYTLAEETELELQETQVDRERI